MKHLELLLLGTVLYVAESSLEADLPRKGIKITHNRAEFTRFDEFRYVRRMEQESHNSDSQDYSNNNYDDDNVQTMSVVTETVERVEQDFIDMWSNPPNEWGLEYWEVFGGSVALLFSLSLCFCIICFAPICFFNEDKGQRASANEDGGGNGEKEGQSRGVKKGDTSQPTIDQSTLDKPILSAADLADSSRMRDATVPSVSGADTDATHSRSKRERRSLWSEVVSVWSEFFTEVFTNKKYEDPMYRKYKEAPESTGSGSGSPRRSKKYRAPSSPRKSRSKKAGSEQLEYETDASTKIHNKVQKYQGMIV